MQKLLLELENLNTNITLLNSKIDELLTETKKVATNTMK